MKKYFKYLHLHITQSHYSFLDKTLITGIIATLLLGQSLLLNHSPEDNFPPDKSVSASVLAKKSTIKKIKTMQSPSSTPTTTPVSPQKLTPTSTPTLAPSPEPPQNAPSPTTAPEPTAVQVQEDTSSNESAQEPTQSSSILQALNAYRQSRGVTALSWDNTLGTYAQGRADLFASQGGMDNHAGFQQMMNDDGFSKMGFNALGENSSWGNYSDGKDLIERFYGSHGPHDENQLNPQWSHVGIGVNGQATNLVFGGNKK